MDARGTAALGGALVLAAAAFDSAALYVPGVALVALAAAAAAQVALASRAVRLEREPSAPTVVEGEPYAVRIRLEDGLLPLRAELRDPALAEPIAVRTGIGGRRRLLSLDARFERRGRRRLEPARLALADPLGICEREIRSRHESEVLVLPRVEPVVVTASGSAPGAGSAAGTAAGPRRGLTPDAEVDGIRPYRPGTPASRIHWPVFARHGELVERHLVSGTDGAPLVIVDATDPADEEALDAAVRAAASLCVELASGGGCVLLAGRHAAPLTIDPQLRSWPRAHARLALLGPGEPPPPPARRARGGVVLWVTARTEPLTGAGIGSATSIVTPFPPPGSRPAFRVAGCAGVPVGAGVARSAA